MHIKTELQEHQVVAGGRLAGTVELSGDLEHAKALTYVLGYSTGEDDTLSEESAGILCQPVPTAGKAAHVPFEISVPEDAPVSYNGRHVAVRWHLEVRLDVPWEIDPVHRVSFTVRPREAAVAPAAEVPHAPVNSLPARIFFGSLIVVALLLMLVVALPIGAGLLVCTGLAAAVLYAFQRLRFSRFTFTVTPVGEVRLNEPIRYALAFRTRQRLRVNAITVKLCGCEVWQTGTGKSSHCHEEPFLEEAHCLLTDTDLDPGEFRQEGEFRIAADNPSSVPFAIRYRVEAHVDIPKWPDAQRKRFLDVLPVVVPRPDQPPAKPMFLTRRSKRG